MTTIALAARAYQQSFDARPYTTLAVTNGTLSAIGDIVAQAAQILTAKPGQHDDRPRYDPLRTLRFFTFGFGMGPLIGRWNKFLEARFPLRPPPRAPNANSSVGGFSPLSAGVRIGGQPIIPTGPVGVPIGALPNVSGFAVAKRVAADQLLMAPVGLVLFIGSMGLLEGRDPLHIATKYREMFGPALRANWQVWPLAQVVNFRYMPLPYRVPFQSTCGIFWNLYLSLLNARGNQMSQKQETLQRTVNDGAEPEAH